MVFVVGEWERWGGIGGADTRADEGIASGFESEGVTSRLEMPFERS